MQPAIIRETIATDSIQYKKKSGCVKKYFFIFHLDNTVEIFG